MKSVPCAARTILVSRCDVMSVIPILPLILISYRTLLSNTDPPITHTTSHTPHHTHHSHTHTHTHSHTHTPITHHTTPRCSSNDVPDAVPVTATPLVPLNLLRDPGFLDLLIVSFLHPTKQLPHTSHIFTAKLLAVSCGSLYEENPELGTEFHTTLCVMYLLSIVRSDYNYCLYQIEKLVLICFVNAVTIV